MKRLLCLLVLLAAPPAASAQTPSVTDSQPPKVVSQPPGLALDEPKWEVIGVSFTGFGDFGSSGGGGGRSVHPTINNNRPSNFARHVPANGLNSSPNSGRKSFGSGSNFFRAAAVSLTNTGARAIKSVRLAFVFTDPSTGDEVLRLKHRSTKKLKPGVTRLVRKEARANRRVRQGDGATMSVEVTEVTYADGTKWRRS